jgi:hypothetical protein
VGDVFDLSQYVIARIVYSHARSDIAVDEIAPFIDRVTIVTRTSGTMESDLCDDANSDLLRKQNDRKPQLC